MLHFYDFTYNFTVLERNLIFLQFYNIQAMYISHRANARACFLHTGDRGTSVRPSSAWMIHRCMVRSLPPVDSLTLLNSKNQKGFQTNWQ
jgi:hypothetical protein